MCAEVRAVEEPTDQSVNLDNSVEAVNDGTGSRLAELAKSVQYLATLTKTLSNSLRSIETQRHQEKEFGTVLPPDEAEERLYLHTKALIRVARELDEMEIRSDGFLAELHEGLRELGEQIKEEQRRSSLLEVKTPQEDQELVVNAAEEFLQNISKARYSSLPVGLPESVLMGIHDRLINNPITEAMKEIVEGKIDLSKDFCKESRVLSPSNFYMDDDGRLPKGAKLQRALKSANELATRVDRFNQTREKKAVYGSFALNALLKIETALDRGSDASELVAILKDSTQKLGSPLSHPEYDLAEVLEKEISTFADLLEVRHNGVLTRKESRKIGEQRGKVWEAVRAIKKELAKLIDPTPSDLNRLDPFDMERSLTREKVKEIGKPYSLDQRESDIPLSTLISRISEAGIHRHLLPTLQSCSNDTYAGNVLSTHAKLNQADLNSNATTLTTSNINSDKIIAIASSIVRVEWNRFSLAILPAIERYQETVASKLQKKLEKADPERKLLNTPSTWSACAVSVSEQFKELIAELIDRVNSDVIENHTDTNSEPAELTFEILIDREIRISPHDLKDIFPNEVIGDPSTPTVLKPRQSFTLRFGDTNGLKQSELEGAGRAYADYITDLLRTKFGERYYAELRPKKVSNGKPKRLKKIKARPANKTEMKR